LSNDQFSNAVLGPTSLEEGEPNEHDCEDNRDQTDDDLREHA
jgi:hypothetical protein